MERRNTGRDDDRREGHEWRGDYGSQGNRGGEGRGDRRSENRGTGSGAWGSGDQGYQNRGNENRGFDSRDDRRGSYSNRDYGNRGYVDGGHSDRGYDNRRDFGERATDEVRSWFGDDDAERRRRMDESREQRGSWQGVSGQYSPSQPDYSRGNEYGGNDWQSRRDRNDARGGYRPQEDGGSQSRDRDFGRRYTEGGGYSDYYRGGNERRDWNDDGRGRNDMSRSDMSRNDMSRSDMSRSDMSRGGNDRGSVECAGDEVKSWFSDDDDDRRRRSGDRSGGQYDDRNNDRRGGSGRLDSDEWDRSSDGSWW